MAIDLLASVRATALVALVTASFSSPIVLKSDAFASASARLSGSEKSQPADERLVAGGVEFAMPATWGRLGSNAAAGTAKAAEDERIGTIVSGVCPGGSRGAACTDGVQLTFVSYSGRSGHELPSLTAFEDDLDAKLGAQFPGFHKDESRIRPGADSIRFLDYSFSWRDGATVRHQRLAAFRHTNGSGVVAMATGDKLADHAKALDGFLASGRVPTAG